MYRYNLENAMTLANKNAGYANIISVCNKTAAAMNDDIVWQDGMNSRMVSELKAIPHGLSNKDEDGR